MQRQLSAALEIDTPMYSKIERGEWKTKRSQIPVAYTQRDGGRSRIITGLGKENIDGLF